MSKCRSCNAEVIWAKNNKSRQMAPIDAEPAPTGNIRFLTGSEYQILTGEDLAEARRGYEPLHLNHFVNCKKPPAKKQSKPAA